MRLLIKKKEPEARYICGLPHCHAIVLLPKRSMTASCPHRDKNGLKCTGLLVLMELTPEGKYSALDGLFQKEMGRRYKQMRGAGKKDMKAPPDVRTLRMRSRGK